MIAAALAATSDCAVPSNVGTDRASQVYAYARRSVQIMALAAAKNESALRSLVAPDAEFSLGAGDVGRPMGRGVEGAVAMAAELKPVTYSFHPYGGIPMRSDPCSPQEITIEFFTANRQESAPIEFKYDHGALRSASGWWTPYESGRVQVEQR